ncbi:DUF4383 domain-containing protein [Vampirovibrio chlorellavorus]|uniref:DUF4383 domain-containing protein n=1 Tax=Vampirovibrio chlorellavorus TaxID=758823 RepID=UPI0026EBCB0C|nr:DUF4383 domain-containing protein [Vampirovibrio chlorellavorus]
MVSIYAKVVGALLFIVGILGGIPAFAPDGMLFGVFMVDTVHNLFHLISGLVLLAAGFGVQWEVSRRLVLGFAIVYGLLTLAGFLSPTGRVLGMQFNMADNVLHLTLTATALMFALPVQRYPTRL